MKNLVAQYVFIVEKRAILNQKNPKFIFPILRKLLIQ